MELIGIDPSLYKSNMAIVKVRTGIAGQIKDNAERQRALRSAEEFSRERNGTDTDRSVSVQL